MGSLRFPFSFPQPPRPPHRPIPSFHPAAAAVAVAAGIGVGLALSIKAATFADPNPSLWSSLSLSSAPSATATEPNTGASFPTVLDDARRLLGVGLRKKSVLGLKSIIVYAFGVYVDDDDVKKLSLPQLQANEEFFADILDRDLRTTVRLQIVYSKLSIRSVRSAFEQSVGNRLKKFSGSENKELLHRFTSLFKDEYKIPRGSVIDISREKEHVLQLKIDGKEIGSIQSKLLCQSILDLYIGEDPFDRDAKEDIKLGLASLLQG